MSDGLVQVMNVKGRYDPQVSAYRNEHGGVDVRIDLAEQPDFWAEFTINEAAPTTEMMRDPTIRRMVVMFDMLLFYSRIARDASMRADSATLGPAASKLSALADMIGDVMPASPFAFAMATEEIRPMVVAEFNNILREIKV